MCARILVVDDDPTNVDLLAYLLSAFGHDPMRADSGASALEQADASVPDLVLCDIQMPGVDGFEVLRRLRGDGRFDATPVIGLTALAMVGDREKILAAGFNGYVAKPIVPETFVGEVEKYLPLELALGRRPRETVLPPAAAIAQRAPLYGGYALIVDDNESNADLLRHIINSLGVEVRVATNAGDALGVAHAQAPSLIVSDIHMPGSDGIYLLEAVKSDDSLRHIPFLLVSASTPTSEERRRAVAAGADAMLLRPLDAEVLLEQFAKWMPTEAR